MKPTPLTREELGAKMRFPEFCQLLPDDAWYLECFAYGPVACHIAMGSLSINGYLHLPEGHPWLRMGMADIDTAVHGGITWRSDRSLGFDTCHFGDKPHPNAPVVQDYPDPFSRMEGHIWTQEEVKAELIAFADEAIAAWEAYQ